MTALAVFLHTAFLLTAGPLLAGLLRVAAERPHGLRATLRTWFEPARALNAGLRSPGAPPLASLATLSLAVVAGLLIPLFDSGAALGFLGDGFVALLLLGGLSIPHVSLRTPSVIALATGLWTLGTLTGTTDLAQGLTDWAFGPASGLLFLGFALSVTPTMHAFPEAQSPTLENALNSWARSTLQLGWLAFAAMAFPWKVTITGWGSFGGAIAFFLVKFALLGWVLGRLDARWPKARFAEAGLGLTILALGLAKLGA